MDTLSLLVPPPRMSAIYAADLARQAERKLRDDKKSRLARNASQPCLMSHALAKAGSPDKKTLDAEDFRFHAVREVAYKKHQDKTPKKGGMKKVFSEIGSLSKWACNELGVQHMYAAFEKRVDKARLLAGEESEEEGEEEGEEEELSLEDMIRDSFGCCVYEFFNSSASFGFTLLDEVKSHSMIDDEPLGVSAQLSFEVTLKHQFSSFSLEENEFTSLVHFLG
ncbi:hypothetical protein GUITHDRAFT_137669 [Guillardia theta CCMP2712]|uniref:Uncharacterized protein n=1 Tax=Guillardia theta (strain CCMP2712) TaxID=905079 RepID=L1JG26_GUITC|nr:hypothetical protein GUITHDRAFT_137669 [Guillardia theta CCMP2712]EKX47050.1 hypothetical protein GUITHDRAFT_137669 [Guillardia theta CCMP2712]|eukprot:XP_005834030.1 hypothetical protein GUITHDRAFT_137669 [Guillardia theta CCMP2712]